MGIRPLKAVSYWWDVTCKAALIKKNKTELTNKIRKSKKLPKSFSHNLAKLVKNELQIKISEDEEELLMRLERNAVWSAKYPAPKLPKELNISKKLSTGQKMLLSHYHRNDIDRIKKLIVKLTTETNIKLDIAL